MGDPADIAWAAGLFEGEGCIHNTRTGRGGYNRGLQLNMTDEDVVRRFHRIVGAGYVRRQEPRKPHWKPQWMWRVTRWIDLEPILRQFLPFLGERRRTAAEALLANPARIVGRGQTHCIHGHEYTPENTYRNPQNGRRSCLTCRQRVNQARYERQKEEALCAAG